MNIKLLTKLTLTSAISALLFGCGDGAQYDNIDYDKIPPPVVSSDMVINVDEESGVLSFDMLEGVSNPGEAQIVTREFTYVKDLTDADGIVTPNFEGPSLPFSTITKQVDTMYIDTDAWKELLVHPYTVGARPSAFAKAVYHFTYVIDNGSPTQVERKLTITVNGIEDKVNDIVFNHGNTLSIAKGYTVQLNTTVLPLNATYQQLSYTSSDPTKATISGNGLITGIDYGNVSFTVVSADGLVSKEISGIVEDLKDPLGLDIMYQDEKVTELTIPIEETLQLSSRLLPDTIAFDNEVSWRVEPAGVVDLDPVMILLIQTSIKRPLPPILPTYRI